MSDSKEKKELLGKLVAKLESIVPYADALYSQNSTQTLSVDNTGTEMNKSADAGVKIRAYDGARFHEVCVQGWDPATLQAGVQRLASELKDQPAVQKPITLKIGKETLDKEFKTEHSKDPGKVSTEEKTNTIEKIYKTVRTFSKEIINCKVTYREETEERVYVNRTRRLASSWTGCTLAIIPFVTTADNETRHTYHSQFSNGFEVTIIDKEELEKFLTRTLQVRHAGRISPGKYTAVLSPNVTGLLAHESFGHGMESDMIANGRAKAEEYLGKKIASAKVNICDDPSLPGTHGFLFFDDEGMLPKCTNLVEKGMVSAPITEMLSASKKNFSRTANGRCESFDHKIYARMTNTFFLSGKDDVKAMIKSVKNGMYLHYGTSGMEDPKGWGVQIAGILAERIKNGKLTGELFYETSIGGSLPVILGNIKMIGKDFEIVKDAGFCGKGHKEYVRVSSGGPHLLIDEVDLA